MNISLLKYGSWWWCALLALEISQGKGESETDLKTDIKGYLQILFWRIILKMAFFHLLVCFLRQTLYVALSDLELTV